MTTYKGQKVVGIERNDYRDVFRLIGEGNVVLAEMSHHEFLAFPQLRSVRTISGKHRKARPAVHSSSVGQPSYPITQRTVPWPSPTWAWDTDEPEPIENAGIRAGEVIAWRCWRLSGGRLRSVWRESIWEPDTPMTGDVGTRQGGVHGWKCLDEAARYCDIHLNHEIALIAAYRTTMRYTAPLPVFIIGTVALWGEIIEHEFGYRAEFAKIKSLDTVRGATESNEVLEMLRKCHGVA